MNLVEQFLNRTKGYCAQIAVVGDGMVDEYYKVDANRVSPEFPIPVLRSCPGRPDVVVPGGAGNVCSQFKHFNVDVGYFGFLDEYSYDVFREAGINVEGCVDIHEHTVPLKRRFYQDQFPLCRWDVECTNYGMTVSELEERQKRMYHKFTKFPTPDVVIFSDYDKGVFVGEGSRWWMESTACADSITIVDPKRGPLDKWAGCSIFKPNLKEAVDLSGGLADWREQCNYFQEKLGCMAVVITQGGTGVVGKVMNQFFDYHPKHQIEADSVIGAGDCFVSFLSMAMAHAMDIKDAVEVAFEAGAVYVRRKHNKPVSPEELLRTTDPMSAKLRMPPVERDYKLVFTNGCFDILHRGHLQILQDAKSLGDKLVVGVNSDESVRRAKGHTRPFIKLNDRMKMLAGLECVDFVVAFEEDTPYDLIKSIKPDVLVKGQDWAENIVGSDIVEEVYALPLVEGLSTSNIVSAIRSEHGE